MEAYCSSSSIHSHLPVYHQVRCCCYRSAPCLVNPPCRAEVIDPSHVVQRSIESISVPKLLALRPSMCCATCCLRFFSSCHRCCKSRSKRRCVQVCSSGDEQVFCKCASDENIRRNAKMSVQFSCTQGHFAKLTPRTRRMVAAMLDYGSGSDQKGSDDRIVKQVDNQGLLVDARCLTTIYPESGFKTAFQSRNRPGLSTAKPGFSEN